MYLHFLCFHDYPVFSMFFVSDTNPYKIGRIRISGSCLPVVALLFILIHSKSTTLKIWQVQITGSMFVYVEIPSNIQQQNILHVKCCACYAAHVYQRLC